jgi:hypothetical protein
MTDQPNPTAHDEARDLEGRGAAMTASRTSALKRMQRALLVTILVALCLGTAIEASPASAASVGMPAAAAGAVNLGWDADVEASCLFSRSVFVTTGQQIDVYLPDQLKALSFYARPWMKIVDARGSRWVTTGWQKINPSTDTGYPISFSWTVSGSRTYFYPAVELYFNAQAHTFSLATTRVAGMLSGGVARPCYLA